MVLPFVSLIITELLVFKKPTDSEFEERRKYYSMTKKGNETLKTAKEYFKVLAGKL
jgi:DNA-binding PadR family transcriptional regulator